MVSEVAAALSMICARCPQVADDAIDLHSGMRGRCDPGRCAKAYMRLAGAAWEHAPWEVDRVADCVRRRLAVEASRPGVGTVERVDFAPEAHEDIEAYCRRMINFFWMDRGGVEGSGPLTLRFCFR